MKFRATLPEQQNYIALRQKGERFLFEDSKTSLLRVSSPVVNPFRKEWNILINTQFSKSDKSKYLSRVVLKLFPPSADATPACLIREEVKGKLLSVDTTDTLHLLELPSEWLIKVLYRFEKPS
ncbi:hypothetical protein NEA10_20760 (plasmid) [Phormidium yuhuli AB48]|jgi:hypothetical protein|uniref:Uncharacterized protein n=1 Tax=Phormidium yuhuli AB48 TaxID=2940671 RepID=A0ABY5AWV2_9CYAN|nr:hypothetical protein [Phormidium yuhuli]USR93278.1 hypothetical protein NEA10_20760 [Phormidium yuhuli AB48]